MVANPASELDGVAIGCSDPFASGDPDGPVIWGCGGGTLGTYCGSGGSTNKIALTWNSIGYVGVGTTSLGTLFQVGSATCNGTTWANASDRNLKQNFSLIKPEDILERVAALPVSECNYKEAGNVHHIGPMAQDFYSAFHVGEDDKHISTIDEGGVALAAIKAPE